jgi:hypothetical protein
LNGTQFLKPLSFLAYPRAPLPTASVPRLRFNQVLPVIPVERERDLMRGAFDRDMNSNGFVAVEDGGVGEVV